MSERMYGRPSRKDVLQLKGLIYVRALRTADGASDEELRRFSTEIRRQLRRLQENT
jgi:hypothetical protein